MIGEDSLADVVTVSDLAELVYHLLGERIMSLLSNFELAERRKRQLEGLPINPTGVVLEKIVSPTEALINGKLAILAGTNNYLGLTFNQECIQAGIKSFGNARNRDHWV